MNSYVPRSAAAPVVALEESEGLLHRRDGRGADELRRIYISLGVVTEASGSAYVEYGKTKVIASVHGPRASLWKTTFAESAQIRCDFKFAPFSSADSVPERGQTEEEKHNSQLLTQAILPTVCVDRYPKSNIEVYLYVLENDGGEIAAALTAASLAIVNAGIEVYDVCSGCCCGVSNGRLLMDPSRSEKAQCGCLITMGYMPSMDHITYFNQEGVLDEKQTEQSLLYCMGGGKLVSSLVRRTLLSYEFD